MLALGVAVLVRERASRESRAFFALALTIFIWQTGFAGMYSADSPEAALRWVKAAYLGIPLIAPALLGFTTSILRVRRRRQVLVRASWVVGILFVGVFLADGVIVGLYRYPWGYYPEYGPFSFIYLAFFCGTLLLAMWEFWSEFRDTPPGLHRDRIRWLIIAFGIAYVALLDYLPAFGVSMYPFGHVPVLVFVGITAWTIGRFRLVDLTPSFAADQILATMADPVVVIDAVGRIRIVNAAACRVFGLEAEEVIGSDIERFAAPGSPERDRLRSLPDVREVRDEEMTLVDSSGTPLDMSVSASELTDVAGTAVGTVLIARDIRDQKEAGRRLRESAERFRSLIENITDAIIVVDSAGQIQFASSSLERLVGWTPAERVGRNMMELIHPDDRARVATVFDEVLQREGATARREYRIKHRDGSWRFIEATVTNLLHDPTVSGIIFADHDVTERRQTEMALRESEEQLRHSQRMEAVGRLAGGIAHDFNNLLTIINGQARLLIEDVLPRHQEKAALEEVIAAGERAAGLTRQLLAFSRKQILQPKVLDLNAIVTDMKTMLGRLIGEDIVVQTVLQPKLWSVRADPGQIEQVVMNLAVNARDAMPHGGTITISTENVTSVPRGAPLPRNGQHVCLAISDTGTGIPTSLRDRVFEPFFTTKDAGKGTGLGLSTVYGIVSQSGGWVDLESAPGEGATFRVYLPRVTSHPADVLTARVRPGGNGNAAILLVEDDPSVRGLVRRLLERSGHLVVEAGDGDEAIERVRALDGSIDLLLTDVVLPGMSGRQLADRLREGLPGLAVLFMSGYTDDALGPHGVLDPGVQFLPKPFGPQELDRAVEEILNENPARAGSRSAPKP